MSKQPYYLDFNQIKNANQDKLGRNFQNYSCLDQSQLQINQNMQNKIFDYTQQYEPCQPQKKQQFLDTSSFNDKSVSQQKIQENSSNPLFGQATGTFKSGQPVNPHSFWGINNSQQSSVSEMSPAFLAMKQQQELTQLQQNSHHYSGLLDEIKTKQAKERLINLEKSNNPILPSIEPVNSRHFSINSNGRQDTSSTGYTSVNSFSNQTTCLNAQGEWQDYNNLNYSHNKVNKYEKLKYMSPEHLNQLYGNPVPGSVLPNNNETEEGDIFDLTSWQPNIKNTVKQPVLKQQEELARKRILDDRVKMQSYNQLKSHNDSSLSYFQFN